MEEKKEYKFVYTLPEVAEVTGLSLSYIYRLSAEGKLPISKVGSRALILGSELEDFLRINIRKGE